ncbi:MAG TPA: carboxypeptidase-like regulatory domain-containing protein [Bacteroidia bacterium]|nr:carboxypeptidase-like regulatory domain-containing protein [Bacteroidia bacterium]
MYRIVKSFLLALTIVFPVGIAAQDQSSGDLKVTVYDEQNVPMTGARVRILAGGPMVIGETDQNGIYTFRALSPGTYEVEAHMMTYKRFVKKGIVVHAGQTAYADYPMQLAVNDTDGMVIIYASSSPVDKEYTTLTNIDAGMVKRMAVDRGNITDMVTATNSSCSEGKNGGLIMRGSRETATTTYVDGEKMYAGAGVPGIAIGQITVLSGGIPAAYGDLTGGAVIITTKSFYTGLATKQSMYDAAAEEAAAAKKAELEKTGQLKETGSEIIEQVPGATAPLPENVTPVTPEEETPPPAPETSAPKL